jgi:hypothetical protein
MRLIRYSLLAMIMLAFSAAAFGQIIQVRFAPPALPVYEQPPCPDEGYLWTPGYWAYDQDYDDYYWVPGTWVDAPQPGYFWTPPYWGWENSFYIFHPGYWGPQVGFYGGIPYGYGYFGEGYQGGRWQDGHFYYNRAVNNVRDFHYVYDTPVNRGREDEHVSYNGGNGGIDARPTPEQEAAMHERHLPPVAAQTEHVQQAHSDPQLRATNNQGRPPIAATPKPTDFRGNGVVQAKQAGAPYHPPANRNPGAAARGNEPAARNNESAQPNQPRPENHERPAVHPNDLPPLQQPAPRNSGNAKADQKYQQQQQKQYAKDQQQREKLQQKQDQEHQKMQQHNANQAQQQQMEQRHQQQTQKLEQRQQKQEQRSAPPRPTAHPEPPQGGPPH